MENSGLFCKPEEVAVSSTSSEHTTMQVLWIVVLLKAVRNDV